MIEIVLALAPVFLLIALGHVVRRAGLLPDAFWGGAETLVYWGLFPCLLFRKAATAPLETLAIGPVAAALLIGIAAASAAVLLLRRWLSLSPQALGTTFQAAIRQNVYVGFAAAAGIVGEVGAALAALCAAVMVPAVNALSIAALLRLHGGAVGRAEIVGGRAWLGVLRGLVTHQLILAIVLGLAVNLTGVGIPPVIDEMTGILAEGALPVALLTVGAGLRLGALGRPGRAMAAACSVKLVLLPAAVWAAGLAVGLEGPALTVAVIFAALPASASGYHMARHMGGDAPLMAALITAQTLIAVVSLPATILLVQG